MERSNTMRYVAILRKGVVVSKGINYTDYKDENEIEISASDYDNIPIPCKIVDGEFVPCDYPESDIVQETETETPKTDAEKIAELEEKVAELTKQIEALKG
jgi:hypothetical protein